MGKHIAIIVTVRYGIEQGIICVIPILGRCGMSINKALNASYYHVSFRFPITGVSYIGSPKTNTAMYVTKKIESKMENLRGIADCLVFAETGCIIPEEAKRANLIIETDNPQLEYIKLAKKIERQQLEEEKSHKYNFIEGSYISKTAVIGANCYIEPGCYIGYGVTIGDNAVIQAGTKISHAIIGDNFYSNEYAVIGANGFTMADDGDGNKIRIPSLGRVVVGNNVEVGAHDNISRGSAGDTTLEDFVKLDAFVYIGHDAILCKNVEVAAGSVIGGFDEIGEGVFAGFNATFKNRIEIGERVFVGMGAVVLKSVYDGTVIVGNPARKFDKSVRKGIRSS